MTGRELVMVVGPGRSGTSVLTSILAELGYTIPRPEVPADATNPRGFAEPQWLVDFHAEILRTVGVHTGDARPAAWGITGTASLDPAWFDRARAWLELQFTTADAVVLKDPRSLWFLGLWERAAADVGVDPVYVTMLRRPVDAVRSRDVWYDNGLDPTNRTAGWVNTMLLTERATRGRPRTFVPFDALIRDWAAAVGRIDEAVGLGRIGEARARGLRLGSEVIDPTLDRSSGATWEELGVSPAISGLADEVYQECEVLADAGAEEDDDATLALGAIRGEYRALYDAAEAIAQSSILAAGRSGQARTGATSGTAAPPDSRSRSVARIIPQGVRHVVPLNVRKRVLRLLP